MCNSQWSNASIRALSDVTARKPLLSHVLKPRANITHSSTTLRPLTSFSNSQPGVTQNPSLNSWTLPSRARTAPCNAQTPPCLHHLTRLYFHQTLQVSRPETQAMNPEMLLTPSFPPTTETLTPCAPNPCHDTPLSACFAVGAAAGNISRSYAAAGSSSCILSLSSPTLPRPQACVLASVLLQPWWRGLRCVG